MGVVTYSRKKDGNKNVSASFKIKEFACHDGTDKVLISTETVAVLQAIRNYFGKPVTITSGYRTPTYNKKVGGVSNSQHVKGKACDIKVSGISPKIVAGYLEANYPNHGIGLYSTFVHVDSRGHKTYWKNTGSNVVSTFRQGSAYTKYKANNVSTANTNTGKIRTIADVQSWVGVKADGIYGKNTIKAIVKVAQKELGVTADGVFGAKTKSAWKLVKQGSKGTLAKTVQAMLICKGYFIGNSGADGVVGAGTVTAIKDFQRKSGVTVDGKVGKDTASVLYKYS